MQSWKTLKRRVILDHSKFLKVEEHTVELPDGQVIDDWSWVITPDFVNVVLVTEDDEFLCFKQTKYGVSGVTLATVGGYLEPSEDALVAAKRELMEETGYEAPMWVDLGSYTVDGNRGSGTAHFYLATGARKVAEPDADDLEEQEMVLLSRAQMLKLLFDGDFKALPWTAIVALALLVQEAHE